MLHRPCYHRGLAPMLGEDMDASAEFTRSHTVSPLRFCQHGEHSAQLLC